MGQNTKVLFALFLVACLGASIFVLRKGQNVAPLSAAKNSAVAVAPAVPLPSAAATQPIVDGSIVTSQRSASLPPPHCSIEAQIENSNCDAGTQGLYDKSRCEAGQLFGLF